MKFTTTLLTAFGAALATADQVTYNPPFDNPSTPMDNVACSDGANGLTTRYGWTELGAVPHFPYVGSWASIGGWNSADCGTCLAVTYNGKTVHMLAIDHCDAGVDMSEAAMNELTGGQAYQLGIVQATIVPVDQGNCGL